MNKTLITFFTVLFCLTSSIGWSVTMDDLIKRDDLYYKKFSDVPYTGKIEGLWSYTNSEVQGSFKDGKKAGTWLYYWKKGQLKSKGNFKNDKKEGLTLRYSGYGKLLERGNYINDKRNGTWIIDNQDGTLNIKLSGTYKNGKKISE
ncbi:MAG: hypothetical protein O3A39_03235 [Proteobacteria bacterium]|jgi:hypothetical protein|nr:hypothetical protein [Pseudomonadota bacterium]MDA1135046.1 hypothetical protein [Pseudomonadota bacterium]